MEIPAQHRHLRHDPVLVARDPKGGPSQLRLMNPHRQPVVEVRPEDFFPAGSGVHKCDFVFLLTAPVRELYVELKGTNFEHALEQLAGTINRLRLPAKAKVCVVVLNRAPSSTPAILRQRKLFAQRLKCALHVHGQQGSYSVS